MQVRLVKNANNASCSIPPMELGDRIAAARTHAGLSRQQLGDAIRPPVTYESVRSWEDGSTEPRRPKVEQIAKLCGVSKPWLESGAGTMLGKEAKLTRAEIKARAAAMTDEERRIWLQEVAASLEAK
jgi:ribosome-binding protein aMBF1 (putative translation factor)